MPVLHLVCGLPGSGKSTLAAKLERDNNALRLTPDDWIVQLEGDGHDGVLRDRIEKLQLDLALRALALGIDVVLDNGFWPRAERDMYRARAASVGAAAKLYFLDVPRDELKRRLVLRNQNPPPGSFVVNPDDVDTWWPLLERPTPDEPGLVPASELT
jgi:predicted kinase